MMTTMEPKDEQEYYRDFKNSQPRKKGKNYYSTSYRGMTKSYKVSA